MIYGILDHNLAFIEWRSYDEFPISKPGRVLPQVVDALPAFDAATQKVVEGVPVVGASDVRKTWAVVALSPAELALVSDGVSYAQAKAIYLDLKNGVGTQAQRSARVEQVLAWLLKRLALIEKGEILSDS